MSIDWAKIRNGETFQAFVNSLLSHEDPSVRGFGRGGPDGAIDAISNDGKTVFQSKFHKDGRSNHLRSDANTELRRIRKYRTKGHANYASWKAVKRWVLITNVTVNAKDARQWNDEIAPSFVKEGIVAELCSAEQIEARALKYPHLIRAYFDGENRVFLSLAEAERLLRHEDGLEEGQALVPLQGRPAELADIKRFLEGSGQWLLVQGPGGIGKTRILYEAALAALTNGTVQDAYWASIPNLQANSNWYANIIPERNILLLLDEPDDPALVRRIRIETQTRAPAWKVIVAVRRPKDPIIESLKNKDGTLAAEELSVAPLSEPESIALAKANLESLGTKTPRNDFLCRLAKIAAGHPVWLMLACRLIAKGRNLSELVTMSAIASLYVNEIINEGAPDPTSKERRKNVLRWLCLLQPLNIEDTEADFAVEQAGISTQAFRHDLSSFTERRAVVRSGWRQRIFELKPDVIREHILLDWLAFKDPTAVPPRWELREEAVQLLSLLENYASGVLELPKVQRVLRRLWVIEFLTNGQVDLLSQCIATLKQRLADASHAGDAQSILQAASPLGRFRPLEFARLASLIRTRTFSDFVAETVLGERTVRHSDVVMSISWPLFLAGTATIRAPDRTAVLKELTELVEAEHDFTSGDLPNDGRRATSLVARLVTGNKEVTTDFYREARRLALDFIQELESDGITETSAERIRSVVAPLLKVERHESWIEGNQVVHELSEISPDGFQETTRTKLIEKIWEVLERDNASQAARIFCWSLLRNAGRRGGESPEIIATLQRALSFLRRSRPNLAEALAVRKLWEHLLSEQRQDVRQQAENCEKEFRSIDGFSSIMTLMLRKSDSKTQIDQQRHFAKDLVALDDAKLLEALKDLAAFVSSSAEDYYLHTAALIAGTVGSLATTANPNARRFSSLHKSTKNEGALEAIVLAGVRGEIFALRKQDMAKEANEVLRSILENLDAPHRSELLEKLYVSYPAQDAGPRDLLIYEQNLEPICATFGARVWQGLGHFLAVDEIHVFNLFENAWTQLLSDQRSDALSRFVEGLAHATWSAREQNVQLSSTAWSRLVDMIWKLPDLDRLSGNSEWHLNEFAKHQRKFRFVDLAKRYQARLHRIATDKNDATEGSVVPHSFRLEQWYEQPQAGIQSDVAAVEELIGKLSSEWPYSYWIPIVAHQIDTGGTLVPDLVAKRLSGVRAVRKELWPWARVAGYFPEDGASWRKIAGAVCRVARELSTDDLKALYTELSEQGVESWSGVAGELHPRWQDAVTRYEEKLVSESEASLKGYWEHRLSVAKWNLERAKGELEEERNE